MILHNERITKHLQSMDTPYIAACTIEEDSSELASRKYSVSTKYPGYNGYKSEYINPEKNWT